MSADERTTLLWNKIVRDIKAAGDLNVQLWRALDAAVPITTEGTTVVVGFDSHHQPDARFLELPGNQGLINGVLAKVATRPLQLQVVDGTTMEEYEHFKVRRQVAAEIAGKPRQTKEIDLGPERQADVLRDAGAVQRVLNELHRGVHARFVATEHHNLILVRAQFLLTTFQELEAAEAKLRILEPHEDQFMRQWSRALERVAEIVETDAVQFTLWFLRYKQHGGV